MHHHIHDQPRHISTIWAISGSISDYRFFYAYNVHENLWRFVTWANLAIAPIVAPSVDSRSEYKLYEWPKISLIQLYRLISQVSYYSCRILPLSAAVLYVAATAVVGSTVRVQPYMQPYSRTAVHSRTAVEPPYSACTHQLYGCVLVLGL